MDFKYVQNNKFVFFLLHFMVKVYPENKDNIAYQKDDTNDC